VDVCCCLHTVYEDFSKTVVAAVKKQYREGAQVVDGVLNIKEFSKKRYMLRLLTELFMKGIFQHYKDMFSCINDMIFTTPSQPEFLNAIMVLTDYFKTYGEQIFHIISRERRVAIDNHYEVMIPPGQRYMFLSQKQLENIRNYFVDQFNQRYRSYTDEKYRSLKEFQAQMQEKKRTEHMFPHRLEQVEN